jgi:hypothetical protein
MFTKAAITDAMVQSNIPKLTKAIGLGQINRATGAITDPTIKGIYDNMVAKLAEEQGGAGPASQNLFNILVNPSFKTDGDRMQAIRSLFINGSNNVGWRDYLDALGGR